MPVFNHFVFDQKGQPSRSGLQALGPMLQVQVSIPTALAELLQKEGKPIPAPVTGLALIDSLA